MENKNNLEEDKKEFDFKGTLSNFINPEPIKKTQEEEIRLYEEEIEIKEEMNIEYEEEERRKRRVADELLRCLANVEQFAKKVFKDEVSPSKKRLKIDGGNQLIKGDGQKVVENIEKNIVDEKTRDF